ncbi:thiolase family protein [Bradyrhizobium cenepequi]
MSKRAGTGVAIVGVGNTNYAALYRDRTPRSAEALGVEALKKALEDAGLSKGDLDGLITARISDYNGFATLIGTPQLRVVNALEGSGRMAGLAVQHAVALIQSGRASTIALVYGNNGRSAGATYGGDYAIGNAKYDWAYGMTSPGASVALMYQRYRQLYGAPDDALAPIAISNRRNAEVNPEAAMRKPLSREEYINARYVAEPLRLYDYCMINDGGVAIILTSVDRAKELKSVPVEIMSMGSSSNLTNYYTVTDLFANGSRRAAAQVFGEAGLSPKDIDVVQIYDNFTPIVLFSLESFGFTAEGEGWKWIRDGRIEREGELPINTSGGHTSEGYMQGWGLQVEAVRQMRGDAGQRQVKNPEFGQYICVSPLITSHIFRRVEK